MSRRLGDLILLTATGGVAGSGSTNGTLTVIGELERYPTSPSQLIGTEISNITIATPESKMVTGHSFSDPTTTLTIAGTHTLPTAGDIYEMHNLGGNGFRKADYDDAIKFAVDYLADSYYTDYDSVPFGFEYSKEGRAEYPVPSSLIYLYGVQYLNAPKSAGNVLGNADSFETFGKTTGTTRVAQGFKVQEDGWYEWISVGLSKVGSPTDNLVLTIMGNSSGVADGTGLTDGTSDNFDGSTLNEKFRYAPFRIDPPIYLSQGTTYHFSITRSGSLSDTAYYRIAKDTSNSYGDGQAQTYAGSYVAVSSSDYCFGVFRSSSNWISLQPRVGWQYRRVGADFLYLPYNYPDACPVRILGKTAIAEPTTETTVVQVPPDYAIAKGLEYLLAGRAGKKLPDDYAVGVRTWVNAQLSKPKPISALPPNSVRVGQ